MKKYLNERSNLTNQEVINLISAVLKANSYEPDKPKEIKKVGRFGIINPDIKNLNDALNKLRRNISTEQDEENNIPLDKIIERDYADSKTLITDNLQDICRFSVIIPNWSNAPAIIGALLGEFGGSVERKDKKSYKGFHVNSVVDGICVEFQIHTEEFNEVKNITNPFYHKHVNNKKLNKEEKNKIKKISNEIGDYYQVIYKRSDFETNVSKVEDVYKEYLSRNPIHQEPTEPKDFLLFYSQCFHTQNDIEERLTVLLKNLTKRAKLNISTNPNALTIKGNDEQELTK